MRERSSGERRPQEPTTGSSPMLKYLVCSYASPQAVSRGLFGASSPAELSAEQWDLPMRVERVNY